MIKDESLVVYRSLVLPYRFRRTVYPRELAVLTRKSSRYVPSSRGENHPVQVMIAGLWLQTVGLTVIASILLPGCGRPQPTASSVEIDDLEIKMPPVAHARADRSDDQAVAQIPGAPIPGTPIEKVPAPPGIPTVKAEIVLRRLANRLRRGAKDGTCGWDQWEEPQVVLFVTGNQHGYIEPCGCTGLENQKGGLARRYTFMKQVEAKGWPIVSIDAGNQVRRTGRQSEVKFQAAATGFTGDEIRCRRFGAG